MRVVTGLGLAAVMLVAWVVSAAAAPQDATEVPPTPVEQVLDVPYLPQPPELCGGAAIAMVYRYWGERGVTAGTFASLVRTDAAGIPTGALTDAVRRHGWSAYPFTGSRDSVRHHLSRGRPVVALMAIQPRRYHYVVVVAWTADAVVVHDPAIAPARKLRAQEFQAAWDAAGRWALLVLPGGNGKRSRSAAAGSTGAEDATSVAQPLPEACVEAFDRGLAHARAQQLAAARSAFADAHRACPASSAPVRELASLALLERKPREAAALAADAVRLEPADAHAWRVLATSRFLLRDRTGALSAWNQVAEPRTDLVQIDGLTRTRFRIVADLIDVAPGRVLTPDALAHAERRIASLPTVRAARVGYRPVPGGLAEVEAAVVERPLVPLTLPQLGAVAARALVTRELQYEVAGPLGGGELWHVSWRFWDTRPAISGGLRAPVTAGPLRGLVGVAGTWEEQSYALEPGGPIVREARRSVRASLADWGTPSLRWELSAGVDRWRASGTYVAIGGSMERRLAGDRATASLSAHRWLGGDAFTTASLSAAWRSSREPSAAAWVTSGTLAAASTGAPLGAWEGAGTGHGRSLLLRAHPLLADGIVAGDVFGRRVAQATVERRQPIAALGPLTISLAGFVDAARHWKGLVPGSVQIDAGAGLRVRVPGEGTLRIDVARGLADGAVAVSAGWQPW